MIEVNFMKKSFKMKTNGSVWDATFQIPTIYQWVYSYETNRITHINNNYLQDCAITHIQIMLHKFVYIL